MDVFGQIFSGTAVLALFTYVGFQLKSLPTEIFNQIKKHLVFTIHIEETTELFSYFETWLKKFHNSSFRNVRVSVSSDDSLVYQHYSDTFILKYKGKRLVITKGREKFENASDFRSAFFNNFRIEGWRAKSIINDLIEEVLVYNKSLRKVIQNVYSNNGYGDWINFGELRCKSINSLILKDKQTIIADMEDFLSKEEWYLERGLSYRRSYLFYGTPGNGKTSLCLALAKYFNKDIYFLNLNDIEKDINLFLIFNSIKQSSILVIEDIDSSIGSRETKSKISFSALLNSMDGVFSKHGIISIFTTNKKEILDDALLREGRMDSKIEFFDPSVDMVQEYISLFFNKPINKILNFKNHTSMAKIQELCLQNKESLDLVIKELQLK